MASTRPSSVSHLWLDRLLAAGVSLTGMGRRSQDRVTCSVTLTVIKKSLTEEWTLKAFIKTLTYTHRCIHKHLQSQPCMFSNLISGKSTCNPQMILFYFVFKHSDKILFQTRNSHFIYMMYVSRLIYSLSVYSY